MPRFFLSRGQVRRIDRGLVRAENLPQQQRYRAISSGAARAAWLVPFRLAAILDGAHSHAEARLLEWRPESEDPTWPGDNGAYAEDTSKPAVVVRGFGRHWGIPGEIGWGRPIVAGAGRDPQLAVVTNPGVAWYWAALRAELSHGEEAETQLATLSGDNWNFTGPRVTAHAPPMLGIEDEDLAANTIVRVAFHPLAKRWEIIGAKCPASADPPE